MNTDACNFEYISILHIKECLLLICVASFEDWSNIFRTRSFTLCKNDLDFNDMSDSATVLESMSSSSTINLSECCANKPGGCSSTSPTVLTSINSSDFHSWEDHFSSAISSGRFEGKLLMTAFNKARFVPGVLGSYRFINKRIASSPLPSATL